MFCTCAKINKIWVKVPLILISLYFIGHNSYYFHKERKPILKYSLSDAVEYVKGNFDNRNTNLITTYEYNYHHWDDYLEGANVDYYVIPLEYYETFNLAKVADILNKENFWFASVCPPGEDCRRKQADYFFTLLEGKYELIEHKFFKNANLRKYRKITQ